MSVAEPPKNANIDWEALAAVDQEAGDLLREGQLTAAAYAALEERGLRAVNGHEAYLETLRMLGGLAGVT